MFDVLIYLFETYIHNEPELPVDQKKITDDLAKVGFYREDIKNALNWLEALADLQEGQKAPYLYAADPQALRIYTVEESQLLDTACRGFILFLEQIQVLHFDTREMVIDRIMALDTTELDLKELKWVVLIVLFNIPGYESAYQQMEELLFEVNEGYLH
ncbi:MAG: hypothetical protein RLY17_1943 [Pseudomonadota bacterium]|jgi:Smg protein